MPSLRRTTSATARVDAVNATAWKLSAPLIREPERTTAAATFGVRSFLAASTALFSLVLMGPK
jgi:hypothetical protein